mgnify:FL=1
MGVSMNRFIIEDTPLEIAQSLCDQHVVKMPLEEAQMLCTTLWHHAPKFAEENNLYKPVHQKHPCTLWAMETRENYLFAVALYKVMLAEYTKRYNKMHGASKHEHILSSWWAINSIPEGKLTKHPQCFSGMDELKTDEFYPVKAYRAFYIADKARFARYRYTQQPTWMKGVAI